MNSLGASVAEAWPRLLAGDNGIAPITLFDASQYRQTLAAEIPMLGGMGIADSDSYAAPIQVGEWRAPDLRRGTRVFLECVREAFAASGLAESGFDRSAAGVAAGASAAYTGREITELYHRYRREDGREVDIDRLRLSGEHPAHESRRRRAEAAAQLPALLFGLGGPALTCDTACAASGHAIGEAWRLIRTGRARVMIAGGAAAVVNPISSLYFAVLGALTRNPDPDTASRPFDRDRDGFVLGEGGGAVVLEDWEHARARGALILAELAGFAATTGAANLTDPSLDAISETRALRLAMESAGIAAEQLGYIAAHGTSTVKNDWTETLAIKSALGSARANRVPVSSNKGQLGHTLSGAAVTNLLCAILAIRDGVLPPTMHLRTPGPELDLDYVPNASRRLSAPIEAAMANAFAFGGHNVAMVVRHADAR